MKNTESFQKQGTSIKPIFNFYLIFEYALSLNYILAYGNYAI